MRVATVVAALCVLPASAAAQPQPAAGVVFVRVIGTALVTIGEESGTRQEIEIPDVQVATGSGLIVSPYGYLVTNHHVIAGGEFRASIKGVPAHIVLTVRRVQVQFAGDPATTAHLTTYEASVLADDPQLDLAVLAIQGADFPYVPFGDSDALRSGDPVSVIGYPLGETLDIGREKSDEPTAPAMATGIVSALRPDDQGTLRYIQTSAPLNRGNSGGPLVDRSGFAVGIVQLKLTVAEGIGFAIPINLVKDFLARWGLDTSLPSVRLTLGPTYDAREKLVRLRVPNGFDDVAPSRLRVDSGSSLPGVSLRVDRIASPWTLERLHDELRTGRVLEGFFSTSHERSAREGAVVRGEGEGHADGRPFRVVYVIVDLGDEKVLARYLGTAEAIAFNKSVLVASLGTLEAATMNGGAGEPVADAPWTRVAAGGGSVPVVIPPGWMLDGGAPMPCPGLAASADSIVSTPRRNFTVSLRVAQYDAGVEPAQAAARCAGRNGAATGGDYRYRFSSFGIDYTVEGRFQVSGSGTLHVEMVGPTRTFAEVRDPFRRWLAEFPGGQP